ncbi:MAG: TIGR03564 family F420-dependent LLM class oxidoreductase, partial [Dehalococcoidia bacterium]
MRIGIMLPDRAASIGAIVDSIVDVETDGFDAAWFGQVFGSDVMTVIAMAGARTSRIEIGTSVVPTYTRHPWVMAQQALTVGAATQGRFTLGIGLSHAPVVEGMWGLSYEKPARHMREYLSVLQPLLTEGRVAFSGDVFKTAGSLAVPGAPKVPVLVAALAPRMLKIAGELTDGTVTWMTGPKTIATHIVPKLTAAATDAGRAAPRIAAGLPIAVTDDLAAAKERAAQAFVVYGQLPNYRRVLDKEGAAGPADVAILGDEAAVERQLR